jgi:hypothetical protein
MVYCIYGKLNRKGEPIYSCNCDACSKKFTSKELDDLGDQ